MAGQVGINQPAGHGELNLVAPARAPAPRRPAAARAR
eukprot:SAG31_NODE_469_length_15244_cov_11.537141_1_plen_36_part_10